MEFTKRAKERTAIMKNAAERIQELEHQLADNKNIRIKYMQRIIKLEREVERLREELNLCAACRSYMGGE